MVTSKIRLVIFYIFLLVHKFHDSNQYRWWSQRQRWKIHFKVRMEEKTQQWTLCTWNIDQKNSLKKMKLNLLSLHLKWTAYRMPNHGNIFYWMNPDDGLWLSMITGLCVRDEAAPAEVSRHSANTQLPRCLALCLSSCKHNSWKDLSASHCSKEKLHDQHKSTRKTSVICLK